MKGLYEEKTYRNRVKPEGLVTFRIAEKETDILISAARDMQAEARAAIVYYRRQIEDYIREKPEFRASLSPLDDDAGAPSIVRDMIRETRKAGVGPMASVAGAIAQYVGYRLLEDSDEVIAENGGDIFLRVLERRVVSVYAGDSVLSGEVKFDVEPDETPLGICTSSGTVGHSLSFGRADAVVICAPSAILSDAVATATCNIVKDESDIERALSYALSIDTIRGVIIVFRDKLGVAGRIRLRR